MAEGSATGQIMCDVRVDAAPEAVFPFFTDPALIERWQGLEASAEPEPGGAYRILLPGGRVARGEYVELDPPARVAFTWGWEDEDAEPDAGTSTVEVTLTHEGDGTFLRLVHRDLPAAARAPQHVAWRHHLDRLALAAAGRDPGPDAGPPSSSADV